jgi:hypothetical protein
MKSFIAFMLIATVSFGENISKARIEDGRNKLKLYGLAECLIPQYEKISKDNKNDPILNDIYKASTSSYWTALGIHRLKEEPYTFKTIYDPYKETEKYVKKAYPKTLAYAHSQTGGETIMLRCFEIYNSKGFNDFIKKQDKYIYSSPY